ncbi:MAG: site-specific integrase [Candidatus Thermoplasmatota archaeon]|nr:site-specific integrase [Candidatus Thermoplasmatota archaeon]
MKRRGRGSRYRKLLEDPEVRRWYDNNARGSVVTADVYLRRLGNFCQSQDFTPKKLAAKSERELYGILLDYVSMLEQEEKAGSYIGSIVRALKSWLTHNDKVLRKKIKIRAGNTFPTLKDERVPTPQELKKIFLSGDKKSRVACALVAHSGLRLQSLGAYLGDDGLRIGDIPELRIGGDGVEFVEVPAMIVVRPELSKAGHKYITFLSEEGCDHLKDYLEERLREGESLNRRSSIIRPKTADKQFISTTKVSETIRKSIRSAGFPWRPYVLRSYFDTQLMLAESKGRVLRDYRTLWMGHKGDIEHTYTTNKGRLPPHIMDDMREAYRRSQEFLQTSVPEHPREEELKRVFRSELLKMAGFSDEEIQKDSLDEMQEEEVREIIRNRLLGVSASNNSHQKVVGMDEIERYVSEGWEFVVALPGDRVILRFPS